VSLRCESRRIRPLFGALLVGGSLALCAPAASAQTADPWTAKSQWFSVRGGYAKSTAQGAGDGNFGLGFGYTRFYTSNLAFSGNASVEILGRFGDAFELEMPWTVDVARHFLWPAAVRPYLGLGAGIYYHQYSNTGRDVSSILPGGYLLGGMNTPISDRGTLGVDIRMNFVEATGEDNPVFGLPVNGDEEQSRTVHWGVKLNYAWVF
jgi:hypothetical protein